MELDLFPQNQLETYIDRVWTYYTKKNLLVTVNGRDYTGLVHGEGPNKGLFVFEPPTGYGLQPVMIKNPNTNSRVGFISGFKDVYECQIQLDVVPPKPLPADSGDIARDLGAGFLRSTLGVGVIHGVDFDRLPACDQIGQYYKRADRHVRGYLHENAILQKAYAFGYDDVCEQSSVGITKNPKMFLKLKLGRGARRQYHCALRFLVVALDLRSRGKLEIATKKNAPLGCR